MPRFLTTICDTETGEIHSCMGQFTCEAEAILAHCYINDIYSQKYILKNLFHEDGKQVIQNVWSLLSWAVNCVNLDQEIMNELNGGDSNASSLTPQE
jgi:hypothetical protein